MSNARDKANIPALNFSSTGIDDNATSTAITIDSDEKVGIRTTSPQARLHVYDFSGSGGFRITRSNNITGVGMHLTSDSLNNNFLSYGDLRFRVSATGTGTGASERMRIDTSGNVGIGTSSPDEKLTIYGTEASDGVEILLHNVGNDGVDTIPYTAIRSKLSLLRNGGEIRFGRDNTYGSAGTADSNLQFYTAIDDVNTERMRITSTGNVGIGTSSPSVPLAVFKASDSAINLQNSTSGVTNVDGLQFLLSGSNGYMWNYENGANIFGTNNTERMRIDSSGNVGINTTNTDTKFSLESPAKISRSANTIIDSSNLTNKFELLKFTLAYGFQPPAMITGTLMVSVINSKSSFNGRFGFRSTHIDFTFCAGVGFTSNGLEVLQAINTLSNSAVNATHSPGRLTALTVTAEVSYDGGSTFGTSFGVASNTSSPAPIVRLVANTTRSNTDGDRLGLNYTGTYSYNDLCGGGTASPVLLNDAITNVT
jgi:hypothetical protein